jgi:catechol 2,3-dioxygenase-like lactoylglutathione lyase family enzyme
LKALGLSLCLLAFAGSAQARPADEGAGKATGAFFALSVADLAASVAWYRNVFALDTLMQVPKQNGIAVTVLEGDGLTVELIQNDQARPLREVAPGVTDPFLVHGLVKAGIVVKNFERTLAVLKERGMTIAFGPYPASGNQKANVLIRDNSGNLLQILGD